MSSSRIAASGSSRERLHGVETRARSSQKHPSAETCAVVRRRSRSSEPRRSKSKEAGPIVSVPSRKRKASTFEDEAKPALLEPSKLTGISHGRPWKRKVAKSSAPPSREPVIEKASGTPIKIESTSDSVADVSKTSQSSSTTSMDLSQKRPKEEACPRQSTVLCGSKEVEQLQKELAIMKTEADKIRKASESQSQTIDDLKVELMMCKKMNRKQVKQIDRLTKIEQKSKELSNIVQQSLSCQICLDLFTRPFVLSPCGHVYCQGCLQQWFRKAPRQPSEDEYEEISTLDRIKSCPCCRTEIHHRPIPLFLVKDIITAIDPSKQKLGLNISTDDPWSGIFPDENDDEEYEYDSSDTEYDLTEGEEEEGEGRDAFRYGYWETDSDFSEEEGDGVSSAGDSYEYTASETDDIIRMHFPIRVSPAFASTVPRTSWAMPRYLELLQRGATMRMIDRYNMRMDPSGGIVARLDELDEVYLGWNIKLPENDHSDGRKFMEWVKKNIAHNRLNWGLYALNGRNVYRRRIPLFIPTEILSVPSDEEDGNPEWAYF